MEVEIAVNGHDDVLACVAFSTGHSLLQEVVGLVLVPVPGRPRLDLPSLHEYLGQGLLAAPKWPQCLVYMDDVAKSHTNKLLRVKLGQRLSLPELNDSMHWIERTFQAKCPTKGTPVSVAIPCERVSIEPAEVQAILCAALITQSDQQLWVVPHPSRIGGVVVHVYRIDRLAVVHVARERLDAYAVPSHICRLDESVVSEHDLSFPQSSDAVGAIEQEASSEGLGPADPLVMELQDIFQDLLDLDCQPAPDTSFFNLGGSSMRASQLASRVRKQHDIPFGGAEVFHFSSCNAIAGVIRDRLAPPGSEGASSLSEVGPASAASSLFFKKLDLRGAPFDPNRMDESPGPGTLFFQLVPLLIVYPVWQLSRFFLFFRCMLFMLRKVPSGHSLIVVVLTLVAFHFLWVTLTPLLFVLLKWTVIGTYQKGRYSIWSEHYLRWWFIDVLRKLIGRGIWGSNHITLNFYYRLLGANIGKNARISVEADVAEYDLVKIGEGAAVEYATVRGFGVDNGCMLLGPVTIGKYATVGARSVVAPYTTIPDDTNLGPAAASYEISAFSDGADIRHVEYNREALRAPTLFSQFFFVGPIVFIVDSVSHMPALLVLYWMVKMPWHHNEAFESMSDLMEWLCDVRRIPFFIGIRIVRALVSPLVYMAAAVLVKWCVIGKFKPGPRDKTSEWQLSRHRMAATLFSRENMQEVADILGRHYELVSMLYRLLGAKVGKRVFWPGQQPIFTGEFDLLEIGDDVGKSRDISHRKFHAGQNVFSRECLFCIP
jgi:acyl carrier protein